MIIIVRYIMLRLGEALALYSQVSDSWRFELDIINLKIFAKNSNNAGKRHFSVVPDNRQKFNPLDINSAQINNLIYVINGYPCLLYTSPSPRDRTRSRMPSSA